MTATDLDHFVVNLDSHSSLQDKIELPSDFRYKSQHREEQIDSVNK